GTVRARIRAWARHRSRTPQDYRDGGEDAWLRATVLDQLTQPRILCAAVLRQSRLGRAPRRRQLHLSDQLRGHKIRSRWVWLAAHSYWLSNTRAKKFAVRPQADSASIGS